MSASLFICSRSRLRAKIRSRVFSSLRSSRSLSRSTLACSTSRFHALTRSRYLALTHSRASWPRRLASIASRSYSSHDAASAVASARSALSAAVPRLSSTFAAMSRAAMWSYRSDTSDSDWACSSFLATSVLAASTLALGPDRSFARSFSLVTTSRVPRNVASSRSRPTRAFTAALCAISRLRSDDLAAVNSRSIRFRSSSATLSSPRLVTDPARRVRDVYLGLGVAGSPLLAFPPALAPGEALAPRPPFGSKVRSAFCSARTLRTSCSVRRWWSALAPTEKSPPPPPPRSRLRPSGRSNSASAPSTRSDSGSRSRGEGLPAPSGESFVLSADADRSCLLLADGVTHRSTRSGSTPLALNAARLTTSRDSCRRSRGRGGHRVL